MHSQDCHLAGILRQQQCFLISTSKSPSTDTLDWPGAKPYLSNPTLTPKLISVISKVVSKARSQVGNEKGDADNNSCKVSISLGFINHGY